MKSRLALILTLLMCLSPVQFAAAASSSDLATKYPGVAKRALRWLSDVDVGHPVKKGDSGFSTTELQRILAAMGDYSGSVDGHFGRKTLAAVKHFQNQHGLTVDGIVGAKTAQGMLKALSSEGSKTSTSQATGTTSQENVYTVKQGDTLAQIAKAFHTSVKHLQSMNQLADSNHIQAGQKLRVPRLSSSSTSSSGGSQTKSSAPSRSTKRPSAGAGTQYESVAVTNKLPGGTSWARDTANGRTAGGEVAIVFTGGPRPSTLQSIRTILHKHSTVATIFAVGSFLESGNTSQFSQLVSDGDEIENGTFYHRDLTRLSASEVQSSLQKTDRLIKQVSGETPSYVHPPLGRYNSTVTAASQKEGLTVVKWSAVLQPYAKQPIQRVVSTAYNGSIIDIPVDQPGTLSLTGDLIAKLQASGFHLVRLNQLVSDVYAQ